ncbi:MAG: hypothetical protein ABWX67_17485 [Allosphingosinicella sp.]
MRLAAVGWALLATLYWAIVAVLYGLTIFSIFTALIGAAAFVLLCWGIRDGAGARPSGSSFLLAGLSALYTVGVCWTVGLAAYIEGHGCALQPETCVGGGLSLMWKVAGSATIFYFGAVWLVNYFAGRTRKRAAHDSLPLAGGAEGRQESQ